jgi:hypothetical protein
MIIHLILANISPAGCPAVMVNEYLSAFLQDDALEFHQIIFNLSEDTIDEHQDTMSKVAGKLGG